jgi:SEL1 protein
VSYSTALEAYSAASKLGSFEASALLGEMYKHGLGVKRDLKKAVDLFVKSAEAGNPTGQRNLGFLYATGVGVKEDQALAVLHYHFASVGGDKLAQVAMGYRHMYGINVPKNCQTAVEFYKPAVDAVVHDIQQFRPPPMMERYSLASEGSRPRPEELDEDVVDYYQYSAARGDPAAQVALGQLYYFGARGVEQSYSEALKWYLLAAEKGDGNAMGHIGNMYVQGTHVTASNATALKYFRQGTEKQNGIAMNGLGYMHMYGLGLPQSFSEAMKLFSTAAEQGNLEARFNLGALYVGGHGVSKDYAKAIYYFTLAANRGHMLALYNLAMMHLNGFGTPRSCTNALQFLKSVGERGSWGLRLQQAYKLYQKAMPDEALLLYLEAAELGYEVAQGNVAYIYDQGSTPLSQNKKAKALTAFVHSALQVVFAGINACRVCRNGSVSVRVTHLPSWICACVYQGNAAAELKIGDYYYYGLGTAVNYRKAVAHYRAASEARNAQVYLVCVVCVNACMQDGFVRLCVRVPF